VLCPRENILFPMKENAYLIPSFWNIYFFVFFTYLMILKKNKIMLRYKGGTSFMGNQTSSKRKEHIDAQCKETCPG
jgi:hypothetical protein